MTHLDTLPKRAPFQVLVLPFRLLHDESAEYAALRRSDDGSWQGIAGGGRVGETPVEAARREASEEAGLPSSATFVSLRATASIPAHVFEARSEWPPDLLVVPEYSFGVDCSDVKEIRLSHEHVEIEWGSFRETSDRFRWDSNRVALWELDERLSRGIVDLE